MSKWVALNQSTARRADQNAVALGYVNWTADPTLISAAAAPSNQEIEVRAIWLPFDTQITNIVLGVSTARNGTVPTGFFAGLASPTKMVAQSANLASSSALTTTGPQLFPLSTPYRTSAADSSTGLFYVIFLQNGAFSVTNVQFQRHGSSVAGGIGTTVFGRAGTAQTALAANGAAITIAATAGQSWWVGCS